MDSQSALLFLLMIRLRDTMVVFESWFVDELRNLLSSHEVDYVFLFVLYSHVYNFHA